MPLTEAQRLVLYGRPRAADTTAYLRAVATGPMRDGHVVDYLAWMRHKGFSEETIVGRMRFFARFYRQTGIHVDDATAEMIGAWRAGLKVSDRGVVRYVSHLRAYYKWAEEDGRRDDNPAARIPVPRNSRLLPRPISDKDLATVIENAPPRIRIMLVLAAWCGMRAKEIALLRRENILDTARRPFILIAADATKGHHERAIPLSEFVIAEIRAARLPKTGYVFLRADKTGPYRPSRVSQLVGEYFRTCGVLATLHMLRHWFGTETMRASHDLRLVQELLGHQSPTTTAGYAAVDSASAAAAVQALPLPGQLRPAS